MMHTAISLIKQAKDKSCVKKDRLHKRKEIASAVMQIGDLVKEERRK